MALIFSPVGCTPRASIVWPKYYICSRKKAHFSLFNRKPASERHFSTPYRLARCSASVEFVIRISSKYTNNPGRSRNNVSMER